MRRQSFLVVDDHPIFRHALLALLAEEFPDARLTPAGSLDEALRLAPAQPPGHIALLDLHLPDSHGADAVLELRRAAPHGRVIVLSAETRQELQRRTLQNGATAFVPKTADPRLLIERLRQLLGGSDALETPPPTPAPAALTLRQMEVLVELARGRTSKEVALSLGLGVETVKTHIAEIVRRLGVRNRTEAIRIFLSADGQAAPRAD